MNDGWRLRFASPRVTGPRPEQQHCRGSAWSRKKEMPCTRRLPLQKAAEKQYFFLLFLLLFFPRILILDLANRSKCEQSRSGTVDFRWVSQQSAVRDRPGLIMSCRNRREMGFDYIKTCSFTNLPIIHPAPCAFDFRNEMEPTVEINLAAKNYSTM